MSDTYKMCENICRTLPAGTRYRPKRPKEGGKTLRKYELMYILNPDMTADEQTEIVNRFSELITSMEGTVEDTDRWEKRKLAYSIKDEQEGYYVVVKFDGTTALINEIDRQMGITETILRHMIIRQDS